MHLRSGLSHTRGEETSEEVTDDFEAAARSDIVEMVLGDPEMRAAVLDAVTPFTFSGLDTPARKRSLHGAFGAVVSQGLLSHQDIEKSWMKAC